MRRPTPFKLPSERVTDIGFRPNRMALGAYAIAAFAIVVDQLTKAWIMLVVDLPARRHIDISPIFDLTFTLNRGVSFGMLSGGEATRWGLSVFSVVVALALGWWVRTADRRLFALSVGLIMGGALGNVIDRVRIGGVIDFLDFSGLMFPWIFNIADACISVGVALLVLDSVLAERQAVGLAKQKG